MRWIVGKERIGKEMDGCPLTVVVNSGAWAVLWGLVCLSGDTGGISASDWPRPPSRVWVG
jgi:hypothetical protein